MPERERTRGRSEKETITAQIQANEVRNYVNENEANIPLRFSILMDGQISTSSEQVNRQK